MGAAAPTALEMVRRLWKLGLVDRDHLELTTEGTSAALLLAPGGTRLTSSPTTHSA